ncbi:DEAD/DEAH box helicase [Propionibacterium australiense]|uniref:DEAD/DEAH box helicase n=1 Tax=Propionibacterium australiense TaxID=119981 RepID=A0A8B3FTA0_9ACTN|nr:DEAD/DEAH box helicase [Propionibacterium australiense]RLP10775.1 DEAD/DEAH box helicase [Propionibacterium australiense]
MAGYGFTFDPFQREACASIDAGHSVLVAAPTGSGKTVVGEYACHVALAEGRRCFYTTPIKALSNQKYHDLVARHGSANVGLLTGDVSVNGEAPIVVMTTEVLRNMRYAASRSLDALSYVVLDEVHYLSDHFRGAVWEEVILGLAASVQIVSLSATVSNAEEFGEWLDTVRGHVDVVVSEQRPVPLQQHVMAGHEIIELFDGPGGRVNPRLVQLARSEARRMRDDSRRPRGRSGRGKKTISYGSGRFGGATSHAYAAKRSGRSSLTPSRAAVVIGLERAHLLPAIFFVFSRSGCDGAVRQLLNSNIRLTSNDEAAELERIAHRHGVGLDDEDRRALRWGAFVEALRRGIAAHHAGLLPAFKAIVEEAFTRGLLKVVFATETLALGINMPARTVVLERLVKYNGQTHVDITPGEYTQLTGRAGRRGIDDEGHAVVLWQPGMDPRAVAGLASRRTYPLRSSFAPNYNMAVNLVRTVGRVRARALLEQSFAQFQTDRRVVARSRRAGAVAAEIEQAWARAACRRGDFVQYARGRERIGVLEKEISRNRRAEGRAEITDSLEALGPGDVCWLTAGRHDGWVLVVEPARPGSPEPNPLIMTPDHQLLRLAARDVSAPVSAVSRVRVPKRFDRHSAADRRALARSFDTRVAGLGAGPRGVARPRPDAELTAEVEGLRAQLAAHPCHDCPDRERHARAAERALRLERSIAEGDRPAGESRHSIAAQFDRICAVLDALGYLDPEHPDEITRAGAMLARIYSELDLVIAEAIRAGVLAGLSAPALAAVLSTLVYESRVGGPGLSRMPDEASEQAQQALRSVWRQVRLVERDHRVERSRNLDMGFAAPLHLWALGASLAQVLDESELTAGDFVRWARQVIDLATQVSNAPGVEVLGPAGLVVACRGVVGALRRDIVDVDQAGLD